MIGRLFQYSTLGALASGIVEGSMTVGELLNEGNHGIGTLHAANGELIILDGIAYLVHASGKVHRINEQEKVPYAAVSQFFKPWKTYPLTKPLNFENFEKETEKALMSHNMFHAIRVEGHFSYMKCRSLVRQKKPYTNLEDAAQDQAEFETENIEGTIIGFYSPDLYPTLAAPGMHLHFLDKDLTFGGHILDFKIDDAAVKIQALDRLSIETPSDDQEFLDAEFDHDEIVRNIEEAE